MQKVKIPQKVDPRYTAAKRLDYVGIIPKEKLERLQSIVEEIVEDAEVNLTFGVDLQGITAIEGSVGTAVKCVCQRCGELFDLKISSQIRYTPDLKKVEELGLEDLYDFVDVDEFGEVDLYQILEDELILALPSSPRHEDADCSEGGKEWVAGEIVEPEKTNPFAVLSKLKSK